MALYRFLSDTGRRLSLSEPIIHSTEVQSCNNSKKGCISVLLTHGCAKMLKSKVAVNPQEHAVIQ